MGENEFLRGFSDNNLSSHWGGKHDHSKQYPGMSKEQYAQRALDLAQSAADNKEILGYQNEKGQIVRYDRKNNDFVKGDPSKGIATMFKPDDGESYFNRWKSKEGV